MLTFREASRGCGATAVAQLLWRGEEQVQLKLIVVGGARSGDEVHVSVPKFIIGRDRDCHLRCNSDVVSRHHCALVVEPNYIAVVDFSSKNGTFVDGERVVREQELHTGSLLAVGPLQFLVQVSGIPLGKPVGKPVAGQRPQENEDHKAQTTREAEEIVDDWSDALDPVQLQSSLENSKRLKKNDPHLSVPSSRSLLPGEQEGQFNEEGASSTSSVPKDEADEEESKRSVDTQTAALDALRKIGKIAPKKT